MVHRLDRPTSGVLIWAKTSKAAHRLSSQFERRRVVKEYWAIVEQGPLNDSGRSGPYFGRGNLDRLADSADESGVVSIVAPRSSGRREAVTKVDRALAVALPPGCAWLRLWPQTGRTHQLRAQSHVAACRFSAIRPMGRLCLHRSRQGFALHARVLSIRHPILNVELNLVAPLPSTWAAGGIVLPGPNEPGC